jgi:hypothetical protein
VVFSLHIFKQSFLYRSWDSSVNIVSDYRLDDLATGVQSPAEAKDFSSSLCVQTGSGAHPASCTMGTGGPFSGVKARPERDAEHSPILMPRSRTSNRYISSPSCRPHGGNGTVLLFTLCTPFIVSVFSPSV